MTTSLNRFASLGFLALILNTGMQAADPTEKSAPSPTALAPLPESEWTFATARHLLWRAGFGGTTQEVRRLHAMGLHQAVNHLVDYQGIEFDCPLQIGPKPQPKYPKDIKKGSDKARQIRRTAQKAEREQLQDMRAWWMQRMVTSPRQLEEKLTFFWHGLLVSGYRTVKDSYAMYQQNELYRSQAAGNYGKLLHGLVHDPAMLRYLDNNSNVRGRPNENLAREIMELFSMGEGQGYTEQDIAEAARALTGNVYNREARFVFNRKSHDPGEKTIFGKTGAYDGDDVVDLILEQPSTARYIAGKLFTFFAYENPDAEIVEGLAKQLRGSNYELRPLLKTLFKSKSFYGDQSIARQVKSPVQLVVGTIRALDIERKIGVEQKGYLAMATAAASMEQDILQPPNVKGWDGGEAWINTTTVFARYNFAGNLEKRLRPKWDKKAKSFNDATTLFEGRTFADSAAVVDYLVETLFPVPPSSEERTQLITFLDADGKLPPSAAWANKTKTPEQRRQRLRINDKLAAVIVLMMSMPEYQVN